MHKTFLTFLKIIKKGFFVWFVIAILYSLFKFIATPVEGVVENLLGKIAIVFGIIFLTGLILSFADAPIRKIKYLLFFGTILGKKVYKWNLSGEFGSIKAKGIISREYEDRGMVEMMEIMGGPTSITWFPREMPMERIEETDQLALDLIIELMAFGPNK